MDREEFAALYQEVYPRLWLVAVAIVGDRVLADDIVQEAALIGWKKIDQFTVGTNFAVWMSEIVRRSSMNCARKKRNRRTITADPRMIDEAGVAAVQHSCNVVSAVGRLAENQTEFDDKVTEGLAMLGEEARCCLLLRIVQQLSYKEISEQLAIPEGTAMSHVHRSKLTLRKHLKPNDV